VPLTQTLPARCRPMGDWNSKSRFQGRRTARPAEHDLAGAGRWSAGFHKILDHPAAPFGERAEPVVAHELAEERECDY